MINISNILPDSTYEVLEKARSGVYQDTFENRKLGRVGQHYAPKQLQLDRSTQSQFSRNGVWTKERRLLHDNLMKDILEDERATSKKNPVVTLMMGAPASGKGTVAKIINKDNSLLEINPDDFKKKIPEYKQFQEYNFFKAAYRVHNESSYLAKKTISALTEKKSNFLIDKVFSKWNNLEKQIETFKEKGYKINIVMVSCERDEAYRRMKERGERSGRYVEEKYFNKAHNDINPTFERLWKEKPEGVVSIKKYNNNDQSIPPILEKDYNKE